MERQKKGIFATEFTTSMKRLLISITFLLGSVALLAQHVIVVEKGNVESLLAAIDEANNRNASKDAEPLFILIPDGYYDMGDRVLTRISGHRVALIGQSTEGTIIRNKPDVKTESISKTAVLQNRGWGNYYQDLTLRNDLDYYHVEPDGRAVCLQDKGNRTICNRVRMLSYQDTYYSDNEKCQHYMKDTEIHGTIDFICGAGDVWFERCRIVTEKRTLDGSGNNIIAAPRTADTQWGYIFNHCTIENKVSTFYYGRGWHTKPMCAWLHTRLLSPDKLLAERYDPKAMKQSKCYFWEYGTTDAKGHNITPQSNVITFTLRDDTLPYQTETVLTKQEAEKYQMKNVFTDWQPDKELKQWEKQGKKLKKRHKLN